MTRINVVEPGELCDQHLLAEWRELTRIPNGLLSGRLKCDLKNVPEQYCLGKGHVHFFTDKLWWLRDRYLDLITECEKRGFKVGDNWNEWDDDSIEKNSERINHWKPTKEAILLNRKRIWEQLPKIPRYYGAVPKRYKNKK